MTVWQSPATANIHDTDLKTAADYLYAQLRTELGRDFRLVDQPGLDTLRVEAAGQQQHQRADADDRREGG